MLVSSTPVLVGPMAVRMAAALFWKFEAMTRPFVLEDDQLVARLVYERMAARPDRLYGAGLKSNYQGQGLKLSKHFR